MCQAESAKLLEEEKEQVVVLQVQSPEQAPVPPRPAWRLKLAILLAVTLQNTAYALVRRYSRGHLRESYSASSALFVMEVAKLLFSAVQIKVSGAPSDVPEGTALSKYAHLLELRRSAKMAVPAVIYLVMNILGFLSLSHIDASTFSIVSQMKVFTTAVCSVLLLGRTLAPRRWRALLSLTLGVVLISSESSPARAGVAVAEGAWRDFGVGMGAAVGDVVLSGFASIYFEKVLKSTDETYSVWDRNFQLAFWSAAIYLPIMLRDNPHDPFVGWSWVAVLCAAVGALGGVLVALSIKHTDSIMKTIATTGSIVLTTGLNAAFLAGPLNLAIAVGAVIVINSVFSYNDPGDAGRSDRS